ncbi:MAG TPA: hypothetical protein VEJ23_01555 [Solirubrobacteraceae bacterium]|nr:hypothetical protein [Solirubrobacteraceae bacterium]
MTARLARDWRVLSSEQRLALGAAVALCVTMLLPWYQQNAVVNAPRQAPLESRNLNAFQVFTFVEAAVLLVALAVIYLLYARAEGRRFQLPGSDGAVVLAAGLWTGLLLIFRLFDKPGISSHGVAANVGVQWGIFFALAASALLAYAGSRMRAARGPEAPLMRAEDRRVPAPPDPYEAGAAEAAAETALQPFDAAAPRAAQRARPRYPPAPQTVPAPPQRRASVATAKASEQLSLEDAPTEPDQRHS